MRTLTSPTLPLLVFLAAILPGCGSKIDNSTSTGSDTGGSTAASGASQGTGASGVLSEGGNGPAGGAPSVNPTTVTLDTSRLSAGDNNAISTGGYWWTYTDHNTSGSQYHATIDKITSAVVALQPVVDSDSSHGKVIQVSGTVPPALPWMSVAKQDPSSIDTYWKSIYPDSMIPAYPAAGVGFGFQHYNAVFDATGGGKWVGIAFDIKANVDMQVVWVSMPMVGTDLPDPNFEDMFPNQCQYYTSEWGHTALDGSSACFAHYREGIFSATFAAIIPGAYNTLSTVGTWHRYCVLYSDVSVPDWANATTRATVPQFDPTRLLKVQWDMEQPNESSTPAHFDVSLDNVSLVTETQAHDPANNCDVSRIGQPPGTGTAG
jgi:hypothetical protein